MILNETRHSISHSERQHARELQHLRWPEEANRLTQSTVPTIKELTLPARGHPRSL